MKTWTPEEKKTLIDNYNIVTNEELAALIPNKSRLAIYKKAYKMGLRVTKEMEFKNRSVAKKGILFSGGRTSSAKGYIKVLRPNHPRSDANGYVMEHILVFEEATGVSVPQNCCIHHLNGNKTDNRPENLCMMSTAGHTKFHHIGSKRSQKTRELLSQKAKERNKNA